MVGTDAWQPALGARPGVDSEHGAVGSAGRWPAAGPGRLPAAACAAASAAPGAPALLSLLQGFSVSAAGICSNAGALCLAVTPRQRTAAGLQAVHQHAALQLGAEPTLHHVSAPGSPMRNAGPGRHDAVRAGGCLPAPRPGGHRRRADQGPACPSRQVWPPPADSHISQVPGHAWRVM